MTHRPTQPLSGALSPHSLASSSPSPTPTRRRQLAVFILGVVIRFPARVLVVVIRRTIHHISSSRRRAQRAHRRDVIRPHRCVRRPRDQRRDERIRDARRRQRIARRAHREKASLRVTRTTTDTRTLTLDARTNATHRAHRALRAFRRPIEPTVVCRPTRRRTATVPEGIVDQRKSDVSVSTRTLTNHNPETEGGDQDPNPPIDGFYRLRGSISKSID